MKSLYIIFTLLITTLYCHSQNTYLPDDNFEKALIDQGYDTGIPDDYVPTANINSLTYLNVSSKSITDLTGIQDFVALSTLICSNNSITDLKISNNTALTVLNCSNNMLVALDIAFNPALAELFCQDNNITSLDMSNNPAITIFSCFTNNLTSLNAKNGNNTNMFSLDTRNNPNLTCIEVDNAAYSTTNWTFIDPQTSFMENCSPMAHIPDYNFEKALIDLGYDTGMPDTYVPIPNIENITSLDVSGKSISDLSGIEYFTGLTTLNCSDNNLSNLLVSKNTNLQDLICSRNNLTSLDVDNIPSLSTLYCQLNSLSGLDLSNNTNLIELNAPNNQLTWLNLQNGNNVNMLGINVTNNPNLTCIDVDNKAYSTANWTAIDPQAGFSETCGSTLSDIDYSIDNITIYPNPTHDFLFVKDEMKTIDSITLFSATGQVILKQKLSSNTILLSELPKGIYFLKMNGKQLNSTKKIIKI